jgi:hypothetical protein
MSSSRQRTIGRILLPTAVLLGTAIACFWPLVRHPLDLLVGIQRGGVNDLVTWYLPRREFPRLALSQFGQLPFWCPWVAGGIPFLGSFQTAVFYPPNWIFWVLPARFVISWTLVAHHLVAAIGAYFLARRLGATTLGASFAAIAFGESPILLARTGEGHLTTLSTVTWYPWALLAYDGLRSGRRGAWLAVVLTMGLSFLAGHPQEFYYLVAILTASCACEILGHLLAGRTKRGLALALGWATAGAATLGLVAAELIPLGIYLTQASDEARLRLENPLSPSLWNLAQLAFPFVLGTPASYGGPGTYFWETICYFGLVPLSLAAYGVVAGTRTRRPVGGLVLLGLITFALAFSEATPLHGLLASTLPGYSRLRCPGRWLMMTALPVACLGAIGLDDVARPRPERRGRLAWFVLLIALALELLCLLSCLSGSFNSPIAGNVMDVTFPQLTTPRVTTWALQAPPTILAASLVCAAMARLRPRLAAGFASLLVLGTAAEFAVFSNTILTGISPGQFPRAQPLAPLLAGRIDGTRVFASQAGLTDGEAFRARIPKFQGYEPIPLDRSIRFVGLMLDSDYPMGALEGFRRVDLSRPQYPELLDLWAVSHFVLGRGENFPERGGGWKEIGTASIPWVAMSRGRPEVRFPFRLQENPDAIQRGFVVGLARVARPGKDEIDALRALDPRREVVLERDVLPAGPRQGFTPARRVEDTPNRVVLEFETTHPGYLVLADAWYPGWTATLDGLSAPILPADVAFRAVAVSGTGKHRVVFEYFPPGLVLGLAISGATALVLTVLTIARMAYFRDPEHSRPGTADRPVRFMITEP